MYEIGSNGVIRDVYYSLKNLTDEESARYFQFKPMLTENQLDIIRKWYKNNIWNFALLDEDYIFFTTQDDYKKFVIFWSNF